VWKWQKVQEVLPPLILVNNLVETSFYQQSVAAMNMEKQLIKTMTGEVFQPVRLYYYMNSQSGVEDAFKELCCMEYDEAEDRWVWLYHGEAKSIKFTKPYASIPPEKRPIVLGSLYSRVDRQMYIDFGSIERALRAVKFFDKHLDRACAKLEFVAFYNRLPTRIEERPGPCFDALFSEIRTDEIDRNTKDKISKMKHAVLEGALMGIITDRNFELVEAFRTSYYEDGLVPLKSALMMRQTVALKRWEGEDNYCVADVLTGALDNIGGPKLH
jgi:hypothetical protein